MRRIRSGGVSIDVQSASLMISAAPRRRILIALFVARSAISAGYLAGFTVLTILGADLSGNAALAGIPAALVMIGRAIGPIPIARVMDAYGRRPAIAGGYALGALGGLIAALAISSGSYFLLLVGAVLLGVARSSGDMSRYVAAEIFPPEQRGRVIGIIVFAATIGAVGGPLLVVFTTGPARSIGLPEFAGPWIATSIALLFAALVTWVFLRPDPQGLVLTDRVVEDDPHGVCDSMSSALANGSIQVGVLAMLVGQAAMTLVMVVVPLHMHGEAHSANTISLAMTVHVVGMFALAPVTGRLVDALGSRIVVLLGGFFLLLASVLASMDVGLGTIFPSVFLVGYGWNACYVGGSSILAKGIAVRIRARVQGRIEALTAIIGALSSVVAGPLLVGGSGMGWVGAASFAVAVGLIIGLGGGRIIHRSVGQT